MIIGMFLLISWLTRAAVLVQAREVVAWDASLLQAFAWGAWYDVQAACFAVVPWLLLTMLLPARLWRSSSMRWVVAAIAGVYAVVLIFISVAEWLFWDEFQVRFNFIAVDYLIFTQEVIDNIRESYPMPLIYAGLAAAGAATAWLLWRVGAIGWVCSGSPAWRFRLLPIIGCAAAVLLVSNQFSQSQLPRFADEFNREIAKNGPYAFCAAFWESEIDFDRFYLRKEPEVALSRAKQLLTLPDTPPVTSDVHDLRRKVTHAGPEKRHNIVLISVESLSAEFLRHFKKEFKIRSWLTPNLDRIADEGVLFTNLYATGTRTVRGLEAMTLCVPPTPGQSIVWRPKNQNLFTTASVCRQRGYDTTYVYGGDAMFDNMNNFFSSNGYRVVDRGTKSAEDITFQNAWGVADEDMFRWADEEAGREHESGKPFFMHVMTVSNHRPFTFPEGRIDMPSGTREAAVKYTDWCIGRFLDQAKSRPWFENTLFIIMADHCHGSAGRMELDVTKYHIPAILWNPGLLAPKVCDRLCSQIDILPTVFGLMNWSYTTRFYGQDVFSPGYTPDRERIFVSNYQKIAYIRKDELAMLKPKQEYTVSKVDLAAGTLERKPREAMKAQLDDAISLYQSASWLFRNGHLGSDTAMP